MAKKKSTVIIEGNNAIQGSQMAGILKGRTEYQYWQSKFRKLRNEQEHAEYLRKSTAESTKKGQKK